tara:strand:+ start:961 stop:1167 length:207 start_codon:yes stop_codon:yes gene_type:complete
MDDVRCDRDVKTERKRTITHDHSQGHSELPVQVRAMSSSWIPLDFFKKTIKIDDARGPAAVVYPLVVM